MNNIRAFFNDVYEGRLSYTEIYRFLKRETDSFDRLTTYGLIKDLFDYDKADQERLRREHNVKEVDTIILGQNESYCNLWQIVELEFGKLVNFEIDLDYLCEHEDVPFEIEYNYFQKIEILERYRLDMWNNSDNIFPGNERCDNLLNKYILKDKLENFSKYEVRFREYWEKNNKTKKDLIYYLHFLIHKSIFKPVISGNKTKPRHYKDFLSSYYYNDKLALSHAKKTYFRNITPNNNHLYTILDI